MFRNIEALRDRARRQAFTLIELLIVVAIIAILAAIAVPNFLDAQARSGVARVMSDMRNVSNAIKLYRTDTNQWPNFNWDGFSDAGQGQIGWIMKIPGVPGQGAFTYPGDEYLGKFLTTPIPYISSVPMDQFNSRIPAGYSFYPGEGQMASFVMTSSAKDVTALQYGPNTSQYFMESAGPDLSWPTDPLVGGPCLCLTIYDPTNGATSFGQITMNHRGFISPNVSGIPLPPGI